VACRPHRVGSTSASPRGAQTVSSLERHLGVKLQERGSSGVRPTEAGAALLSEARAILARHGQALRRMSEFTTDGGGVPRLGVPFELPADLLERTLARFSANRSDTRVVLRHLSTAAQLSALRGGELDVGLVRERPAGEVFDAMLVLRGRTTTPNLVRTDACEGIATQACGAR
jgi:DNA-binding transcriptional LysR family regulator